ncbi:ABC transporter substrate-binding protein [Lysinibacillus sphaericus]|uniref:Achromobactin-binding periplasmic protein n=1 Tax=Lysinibacillus sphaericus OT4b.31 TaxID=1285586 RepID=R7ZBE5_LYSSH|nr:iron-siderophore ABC transporter substrate-binding protein [Lysinibacillus sphaericus]EON71321.1 achromobactin-binding periplasmic protein [Lysinibacillus sphaericus OT4b.31]
MNKKYLLLFFTIFASLFVLAACGDKASDNTEKKVAEKETEEQSTKREITHALGTTTIEGTPQRVVTLYQGATDTILEFDVTPVGVVESWAQAPMYDYIKEDLKDVKFVGQETQPNLEEIAALKPDLIIATQVRHEEIYEQLSQIAPTIVNTTLYDFKETATIIGQALDKEEQAKTLIGDWEARVADFKNKVASTDNWPLSAAVLNYREDHARIYVKGFAGSILTELGFEGPKDLQGKDLEIVKLTDKEGIPQMNADITFQFMEDNAAVKKTYEDWTAHPLYKNLDAAKNNQVYTVDEIIWNLAGGLQAAHLMLDEIYDHFELEK